MKDKLVITSSPQFHNGDSTLTVMWSVSLALIPALVWGVAMFGLSSLWIVLVSIVSATFAEFILNKIYNKSSLWDGSAFLTGLLIGLNMPPQMPGLAWIYVPLGASFFAIFIVKGAFGGLGNNWMNPALGGRVFVFFSWTKHMTVWEVPMLDGVTGATPLGAVKSGLLGYSGSANNPLSLLNEVRDNSISYFDLFLGKIGGSIGEVSALLLLVGAIYLIIKKIIRWEIFASYLLTFTVFIWIFDGTRFGNGLFTGDILFHLLSGGLILGVFFMATDMVTSPISAKGMIIYGIGCGFLTFLFRVYGANPEGVSLAIIVMNIIVPIINRYSKPRLFGHNKKELENE
ncbi:RnfABCDGE type electron transport complex subunit D [Thiospirochaeta perfilievii]|uniref:Ion-translocating oxidoreductase complex subunit D n=1 Tax=Thiospirochaeta perfilievii TaxID=252967 RepID=A0A5C1Q723_9SPIO|nr:RnfABCDGE type electron transport complex subunit D [Thiospirochaeta perfilievii]QEN03805.1 RnfABCDGE type electron transport complex subunit D [Thiospirochaeta perfilievii]